MALIPDYSKGKASAARILSLKDRQTKIDPQDMSGITLVSNFKLRNTLWILLD